MAASDVCLKAVKLVLWKSDPFYIFNFSIYKYFNHNRGNIYVVGMALKIKI